jgi:hypothetical protein
MAVPQYHLVEVVAKVLAVLGPPTAERVRQALREVAERQGEGGGDWIVR